MTISTEGGPRKPPSFTFQDLRIGISLVGVAMSNNEADMSQSRSHPASGSRSPGLRQL